MNEQKKKQGIFVIALAMGIIFVFHNQLLGRSLFMYTDIGSDTIEQYYPFYMNVVEKIRGGEFSLWNFSMGAGASMFSNISWLMDPFAWLVIGVSALAGVRFVKYMLVIAQICKIFASVFLCNEYLKTFGFGESTRMLVSYLYGFNGYLMLWGQHYFMGTACVYMVLLLLVIEKALRRQKCRYLLFLSAATASVLMYSLYMGYMMLLLASFYTLVRLIYMSRSLRDFWKKTWKLLVSVCVGIGISAVILLPSAFGILGVSDRVVSDTSVFEKMSGYVWNIYQPQEYLGILSRLMTNNALGVGNQWETISNYYEMPQLALTLVFFIILGQFLVYLIRNREDKKFLSASIAAMLLSVFLIFHPLGSMIFNGFAYPFGRYTFVLMPVFGWMTALVWEKMIEKGEVQLVVLGVSTLISIGILVLGHHYLKSGDIRLCGLYVLVLLLFAVGAVYKSKGKKYKNLCLAGMALLLVGTTVMDAYLAVNKRIWLTADQVSVHESGAFSDTVKALEYLASIDDSFYRVEKNYFDFSLTGDSLLMNYDSSCGYNSMQGPAMLAFYEYLWPQAKAGNNYFIQRFDLAPLEPYPCTLLNVKYIFSKENIDNNWCNLLGEFGDVKVYRNQLADSIASFYTKTISEKEALKLGETERVLLLKDTLIVGDEGRQESGKDSTVLQNEFKKKKDSQVTGTVETTGDGILLLSIPYQEGWSFYVDGKKTEAFRADYGFHALQLAKGKHEIVAKYRVPLLKEGMAVSLGSLVLLLAWGILLTRLEKRS